MSRCTRRGGGPMAPSPEARGGCGETGGRHGNGGRDPRGELRRGVPPCGLGRPVRCRRARWRAARAFGPVVRRRGSRLRSRPLVDPPGGPAARPSGSNVRGRRAPGPRSLTALARGGRTRDGGRDRAGPGHGVRKRTQRPAHLFRLLLPALVERALRPGVHAAQRRGGGRHSPSRWCETA
jgi:hypothetical protein